MFIDRGSLRDEPDHFLGADRTEPYAHFNKFILDATIPSGTYDAFVEHGNERWEARFVRYRKSPTSHAVAIYSIGRTTTWGSPICDQDHGGSMADVRH